VKAGLDVALALRRIVRGFWLDFAPIVLLGFGMLTLPRIASALVAPTSAAATILAVVSGLLAALFLAVIGHGAVERLRGRPLDTAAFVSRGIVASPPAFSVALLIGAGLVGAGIVALLVSYWDLQPVIWGAAIFGVLLVLPAVPAADAERLGAVPALARAFALTRRNLGRLVFVVAIAALAIGPAWLLIRMLELSVEGDSATLLSPGVWLQLLFELLAAGLIAMVPAVIYVGLVEATTPPSLP
jgi:hypothetical protein